MARWQRGEAEVGELIRRRELEPVTGSAADGAPLLAQAHKTAATAAGLVQADAHSAYVLAYDAARSPASPCWHSKVSAPPPTEVTTRWNAR
jgi:hypothetical protein